MFNFIFYIFKILGWKIKASEKTIEKLQNLKKYIIVGEPHTSILDIFLLKYVFYWYNISNYQILVNQNFYIPYFGILPIKKNNKNQNFVQKIIHEFEIRSSLRLMISPGGARKKTKKWHSGFYRIAKTLNIPIIVMAPNLENKTIYIFEPQYITGNIKKDMDIIRNNLKNINGIWKTGKSIIKLKEESRLLTSKL